MLCTFSLLLLQTLGGATAGTTAATVATALCTSRKGRKENGKQQYRKYSGYEPRDMGVKIAAIITPDRRTSRGAEEETTG